MREGRSLLTTTDAENIMIMLSISPDLSFLEQRWGEKKASL